MKSLMVCFSMDKICLTKVADFNIMFIACSSKEVKLWKNELSR